MNLITNYQPSIENIQSVRAVERDIIAPGSSKVSPKNCDSNNKNQSALEYKPDILDIFSEKVVNKRDLSDMVSVPRTIFKGYLCFTAGTTVNAIAGMMKQGALSKGLNILGSLISIYGTFNFVKPFLIKDKNLTETGK